MKPVVLKEGIYWVGAVDWDLRYFHGRAYSTHRGTTYNSYLIVDDKITLVDTVYGPFASELLERIRAIVDPARIDYVVVNHIEIDHSGALPEVMKAAPRAKIFCSAKGKEGLQKHFQGNWEYQVVNTGTELSLGRRTLVFVEAPMLHWPDSMFTYVKEDALLMPNDAFGQHLASSFRFDDENDMHLIEEEAAKYYANILYPLSKLVLRKLEEVQQMGIPITMIAPSHGIIWRKDPGWILSAYHRWASGEWQPRALVAYDTMWGGTETMARYIIEGLADRGVDARLYRVPDNDLNDIITELLSSRLLVLGSSTIHRHYLPTLSPLLDGLVQLKPVNRIGAAFGSYGWSRGAVKAMEKYLEEAGITKVQEGLEVLWVPGEADRESCYRWGQALADQLK